MAKLYFKYGAMGSSKTANALITKFNYEERGMKVWLIKPSVDIRDGKHTIKSRIGLSAEADIVGESDSITELLKSKNDVDVIISDECQFFKAGQIDELREIVDFKGIPVMCFGLRTDFKTQLFEGSKRLFEVADSITEVKTICSCGRKATVNARVDENGFILTKGRQVLLGDNDRYIAMCHRCYSEALRNKKPVR